MLKVIRREVPLVHEGAELAALCSLMTDCWKYRPEERPHVNQCCKDVQWMVSLAFNLLCAIPKIHPYPAVGTPVPG